MWEDQVLEFFALDSLRKPQRDTIQYLLDGKDVFLSVRTGGGKSLCYMAFPVAARANHQNKKHGPSGDEIILIVSPLKAIMTEQSDILNSQDLSAVCLVSDMKEKNEVINGEFQFLFTSPETILDNEVFRRMLRSEKYKGRVGLIVIDEAHTVVQWGQPTADGETPFREWFGRLGELRSLLPSTPLLALTATASKKHRRKIQKLLCMQHCKEILENPDRPNIKLHVTKVKSNAPLTETFAWLPYVLKRNSKSCPRILIFCKSINDCSKLYFFCQSSLSKETMKHVDMFHSQTPEQTKARIREDMGNIQGMIRVLVCTTAASMGVNYAGVNQVVNFGPPQEMDTLLQQQGRAGRDGDQAHHLIVYNNCQLRNVDVEVLNYVRNEKNVCRRGILLSHYSAVCDSDRTLHTCCDVCTTECSCDSSACKQCEHFAQEFDDGDSDSDSQAESTAGSAEIPLTDQQKEALKLSLDQYREQLSEDHRAESLLTDPEILHGLTAAKINTIISKCTSVHSADDVFATCALWTYEQAQAIHVIIASILESDDGGSVSPDDDYIGTDD